MKKITKFEKVSILIWIIFGVLFILVYIRIRNNETINEKNHCDVLSEIASLKNEDFSRDGCTWY